MIPIPPPVCLGQKITVDGYNQLLDVMRQLQPIAGPGILLEETLNGVVFRLADQPQTQTANPFDHPWKCTIAPAVTEGQDEKYTLTILKGSFYLIGETGAARQDLAISDSLEENIDNYASKARNFGTNVALSIVYHAENDTYRLALDDVKEGETTLFTIATIHGNTQGDAPWVEQHLLEDLYYWKVAGVAERAPEPFEVRLIDNVWKIYAPTVHVITPGITDAFVDAQWASYFPPAVEKSGWLTLTDTIPTLTDGKLYFIYRPQSATEQNAWSLTQSPSYAAGELTVELGTFKNEGWTQKRKGSLCYRVSVSPPCVVNVNTGGESYSQDISGDAIKSYIGRTYYIEELSMGAEIIAEPCPVYKEAGKPFIAGMGMEVQFRNPLLANNAEIFMQDAALFPTSKIGNNAVIVAQKETQKRLEGITVETPTADKEQGRLYSSERTGYVWAWQESGAAVSTDLLYTEVEEANTLSVYSGA